jgi:Subtilase family
MLLCPIPSQPFMSLHLRLLLPLFLLASARTAPAQDRPAQNWIVSFKTRSFDLGAYREAILDRRSTEVVDSLVRGLEEKAIADQSAFALEVQKLGGRLTKSWWITNACLIQIDPSQLPTLLKQPRVLRIDVDQAVAPAATRTRPAALPFIDRSTDARNHNADAVHLKGIKGKGGTAAILDAGQDENMGGTKRPHAVYYLEGNTRNNQGGGIKGSRLLQNFQMGSQTPDDVSFHGTAVAGVLAGAKWNQSKLAAQGQAPEASILSYALADTPGGLTKESILISAWQKLATDRSKYNTLVANNSYLGSPDPTHPVQQALDSVNLNADVLVVTPAGNLGRVTNFSQSNTNGVTVGATHSDTRKMAAFTAIGPIFGDPKRNFPDICANGANLILPKKDDEKTYYVTYGTSIASPQVAGAALLFRTVNPKATALQTKAALLSTADDISAQNPKPPWDSIQSYGMGYLRTDRLVDLAQGKGVLQEGRIGPSQLSQDFKIPTVVGRTYSAVLAWNRQQLWTKDWDDLSLSLYDGAKLLDKVDSPRNLYERLSFTATKTAQLTLRVTANASPLLAFDIALAVVEQPRPFLSGSLEAFGSNCPGTGLDEGVRVVSPPAYAQVFAPALSNSLIGGSNQRYQQLIPASTLPANFTATGIAFRQDESHVFADAELWVEMEIKLGPTQKTSGTLGSNFASNFAGTPTLVMRKRRISLPILRKPNLFAKHWAVRIPFDKNYTYKAASGTNLLFQGLKTANSDPTDAATYSLDAYFDSTLKSGSVLVSGNLSNSSGILVKGYGLVVGFLGTRQRQAAPRLAAQGLTTIGMTTTLSISGGLENSAAGLIFGFSSQKLGSLSLPLDLSGLGAKGCYALTSIEHIHAMPLDKNGEASVDIVFPSFSSMIGATLYTQSLVLDSKANGMGMVFSNGQALNLGGQR